MGPVTDSRILVVTSHDDTKLAVRAMELEAFGYLTKDPSERNQEYNDQKILQALTHAQREIDLLAQLTPTLDSERLGGYVCKSEKMKKIDEKFKVLAGADTTVLILGESGLGKTHAAKRLSLLSQDYYKQKNRPFVFVDINTIPANLQEGQLFGWEKGAFTGADARRQGFCEQAAGGDLFLDEIGDASPALQGALLKVIDEKQFRRLGGEQELKLDARLIFATNKNLEELVKKGQFRSDLHARMCTVAIEMPSLNERKEDIPYICQDLCNKLSKKSGQPFFFAEFPKSLQDYFLRDNIPHNVRGLIHCLENLFLFCPKKPNGKFDFTRWRSLLGHMPQIPATSASLKDMSAITEEIANHIIQPGGIGLNEALSLIQKKAIEAAEKKFRANKDQAEALKVSPSLLISKKNKIYAVRG